MKFLPVTALTAILGLTAVPASAATIIADFSQLGTVYDNSSGQLSNTGGVGYTNVTSAFKADANAAIADWERALLVPFTLTTTITLADLSSEQAVGDSLVTSTDANGRPLTSQIRVDDSGSAPVYVSANPYDNSLFSFDTHSATINGDTVNVSRFGQAKPGSAADNKYDLLTLFLHEFGHSLGLSGNLTRFTDLVGQPGSTCPADRTLAIPKSVSGYTNSFGLPIVCDSSHFDGTVNAGEFNNATLADPGFGVNQRALLTGIDILADCTVEGATANQCNANPNFGNPNAVPEPSSLLLLATALSLGGIATWFDGIKALRPRGCTASERGIMSNT